MKLGIIGTAKHEYTPELIAEIIAKNDVHPLDCVAVGTGKTLDAAVFDYCTKALVPAIQYNTDFAKYRKAASYKRNCQIIKDSDKLLLIWDGKSKGCKDAFRFAKKQNKPAVIYNIQQ